MKNKIFILLVLVSEFLYSQQKIEGKVHDSLNESLPFVNVLLLNPSDLTLVKGTITDDNGKFKIRNISKGNYILSISFIGYVTTKKNIEIISDDLLLESITLTEQAETLEEIVIKAKKPLYEQKIDRLVINVKNSIVSAGGTALEVLERSPGVSVNKSQNILTLDGNVGVLVMINGKISRQPISAIIQMLDGMNAQNIEKIDLITTPPAKYEAAGSGGIIDIRLSKTSDLGLNGSFSTTLGYGKKDKEGVNLNLNYRKKKVNIYSDLSFNRDHKNEIFINKREVFNSPEILTSQTVSIRNPISTNFNGKLGLDYELNEKTFIGGFVSAYLNEWNMQAMNVGFEESSINPIVNFVSDNIELNRWSNALMNFNFKKNLSSKSEINFDIDYLHYNNKNPTSYENQFTFDATSLEQNIKATKDTPINIWVGRVDYNNNVSDKLKLEIGIKGTTSNLDNNVDVQENNNNAGFIRNDDLSEFSSLKEQIGALYLTLDYKFDDKTKLNIGLRYEQTITNLTSQSDKDILDLDYSNFFPTMFLSRSLGEKSNLNMSYGKRITRPSYNDLAPFVIFIDPNTYFFGNTALQPSVSDNFKMGYQINKTILSLQYNHESEAIARYEPIVLETGEQVFTSINLDYRDTYTLSFSQRYSIFNWWKGNLNVMGIHSNIKPKNNDKLNTTYFRINGSQTFKLPKNFSFEVSGNYQSKSKSGISLWDNIGNITLGFEKKLKNDSKLRLTYSNLFDANFRNSTANDLNVNYFTNTEYKYESRILKLSYTYPFGNKKLKESRNRSTGADDIKSRVN